MQKNTLKNLIIGMSLLLTSLFFVACDEPAKPKKSKALVTVSTFILQDIASNIAGDTLELFTIVPAGIDIHSFEPTPKIMAKIEESDLLFYNGAGLESWLSGYTFKSRSIAIGNYIKLRSLEKNEHDTHAHHDHQCAHTTLDPHIWFDIKNMKRAANIMTYEFITLLPQHKGLYLENRDRYIDMLNALDELHKEKLKSCKLDTIITDHNAFSYLSDKYHFNIKTLSGLSPDTEVSPKDIIRIMEDVKTHKVPVVFFENFGSDKSMKNLASQVNVKVDSLHPLGNITKDDADKKRSYEEIMKENLEKISKALICQ